MTAPVMRARRRRGFTLPELIIVMILLGVLAAMILPRLTNGNDTEAIAFGDRIVSVLHVAHKAAITRRRVVCVATTASAFKLRIALSNPAPTAGCAVTLTSQADADSATTNTAVQAASANGLIGTTLYFQPNGDITTDLAGANAVAESSTITVSANGALVRTIAVEGAGGHVE